MKIIIPSTAILALTFLAIGYGSNISKIVRCQCKVHDPTALQNVRCWSKSVNRTYAMANIRVNVIRVLNNILVNFQVYRRTGVNFRPFLVNITEDYCAFFAKNRASKYFRIFGSIYLPYTNMNHTCPYSGEAILKDMPIIMDRLPSIWPPGEYRLDVNCFELQQKLLTMEFFVDITESRLNPHP